MRARSLTSLLTFALTAATGCGAHYEREIERDLAQAQSRFGPPNDTDHRETIDLTTLDGSFRAYLAIALEQSPEIRAAFARWRAATLRISGARQIPEPMISYGYFIRSVQTRVGPQRHRLSLRQTFPWPTRLSAGADAASARARAEQRRFDARVLSVQSRLADAYWRLWLLSETHRLKRDHDQILETLAGAVRSRVQTGEASLADLNQLELAVSRHHDHLGQHQELMSATEAEFTSLLGVRPALLEEHRPFRASDRPESGLPSLDEPALRALAEGHPSIEALGLLTDASAAEARAATAERYPNIQVGMDYIAVGEANTPGVAGSGDDAVSVSLGLSLPLFQGRYRDAARAAEAEAEARELDQVSARYAVGAEVSRALAQVRDAQRRITLHEGTLIPQADTAFQSVLGSYRIGRSTLSAILTIQRDLLELQLGLATARADLERAWARLEQFVGQSVERIIVPESGPPEAPQEEHHHVH